MSALESDLGTALRDKEPEARMYGTGLRPTHRKAIDEPDAYQRLSEAVKRLEEEKQKSAESAPKSKGEGK
jgi:hypothetical protein